ncbi:MAG: aldo/keto reductase [Caldilinea sp. CFX5]|nr:aldo/keto reductase [Caldilinea sp. CFX5]
MQSFAAFVSTQRRPLLGLGLAALGRPGYINLGHGADLAHTYAVDAMERHAHRVLDAAWAQGIRYFDAARSYGRAEEFLGHWLRSRSIEPSAVAVGSKWGYTYTADWQVTAEKHEVKEHSLPVLERQWQESQTQLAGYLRLYQIHSATLESAVLTNRAVLNKLAALKQSGIAIGLSLSGAQQAATLTQALAVTVDGVRLFDAVQATWNLLEQSATAALQAAHNAGVAIIVKEALANGRLTLRNNAPTFAPQLRLLQQEATRLQTTIDALALAAVLAQPWATIVLSGAATVAQLASNGRAGDVRWDEEAAAALAPLVEPPPRYWAQRSELAWN